MEDNRVSQIHILNLYTYHVFTSHSQCVWLYSCLKMFEGVCVC